MIWGDRLISEDEVSEAVATYLISQGFSAKWIKAGQQGYDIEAWHKDGRRWVIEAKGATKSKPDSSRQPREYPNGQIFTLVAQAFLTAVSYLDKQDCAGAKVGIAVPRTKWFDTHSAKIERICRENGISIFRVDPETLSVSLLASEGRENGARQ